MKVNKLSKIFTALLFLTMPLILPSCGDGSSSRNFKIDGVDGPKVFLIGDDLLINVVLKNVAVDGGIRYQIPKFKKSYLEVSPDLESEGTLLGFSISLDDLFSKEAKRLDPLTLPGGRPIPGVVSGSLPAIAFSVDKLKNLGFYVGPKIFGLWVPLEKLNLQGNIITTRFYNGSRRIGNLSVVGKDENGENSGLFLALTLSSYQLRKLKRRARRY